MFCTTTMSTTASFTDRNGINYHIREANNKDGIPILSMIHNILMTEYTLNFDPEKDSQEGGTDYSLTDIEGNYLNRGGIFFVVEKLTSTSTFELVGSVALMAIDNNLCELQKMYLKKNVRGVGLGKHLLELAIRSARKLGYKRIELETAASLKEAIFLYEKYGFRRLARASHACRCEVTYELLL